MEFSLIDIVDTSARKRVGEIKVDSTNIEAMTIEKNSPKLFANTRDKNVVGAIDREKKVVLRRAGQSSNGLPRQDGDPGAPVETLLHGRLT